MFIKKINLVNIRSYKKMNIEFKVGSTLLSGDVGSGKTSILLAIEFALFGLHKGENVTLLRNGEKEGSVEVEFEINNKNYIIKRMIKENGSGNCFLVKDNQLKAVSVMELKNMVLEILNYPKSVLTKKSLLYRYTVYTPQDEMKVILSGDNRVRLETLRKVFNVDKYKRIKDNSQMFSADLRVKKKEIAGIIYDLEEKKVNLIEKEKEFNEILLLIEQICKNEDNFKELINRKKLVLIEIELGIKVMNENKLKKIKLDMEIKNNQNLINNNLYQINLFNNELNMEIKIEEKNFANEILKIEGLIKEFRSQMVELIEETTKLSLNRENSERIKKSISDLDICPTCKQSVSLDYKTNIICIENKIILEAEARLKENNFFVNEIENKIKKIEIDLVDLRQKERENDLLKQRIKEIELKQKLIDKLSNENKILNENSKLILNDINQIKIETSLDVSYTMIKRDLDELINKEKIILNEKIRLKSKEGFLSQQIDALKKEIFRKEKLRNEIDRLSNIENFVSKDFGELMNIIEKKIMIKIYSEFNGLFKNWFRILLDDDLIEINLDEEFTPLIIQNGYDINFDSLSGGEKTAVALAYRLALNQVINGVIGNIETKDLIILDEPTDGFSNEQVDKIKDLLEELKMKQVLIVSHEPKIEDFVDHIIRIKKEEHMSFIS